MLMVVNTLRRHQRQHWLLARAFVHDRSCVELSETTAQVLEQDLEPVLLRRLASCRRASSACTSSVSVNVRVFVSVIVPSSLSSRLIANSTAYRCLHLCPFS